MSTLRGGQWLAMASLLVLGCDANAPLRSRASALSTGGVGVWQSVADDLPTPRDYHVLVEVPTRQAVWMFGGIDYRAAGILWEWDGATWSSLGNYPELARALTSAVFDPIHNRVLVFGGRNDSEVASNDLWAFDPSTTPPTVTPLCDDAHPCPGEPPQMLGHTAVFDVARNRLVVVGGIGNDNHVWEWSEKLGWEAKCEPGLCTGPTAARQVAVYDANQAVTFVFDDDLTGAPWVWDGTSYSRRCTGAPCAQLRPSTRANFAATYSALLHRVVIFGGSDSFGVRSNDVWTWDGVQWRAYGPGGPSPRWLPAMAWHDARSQILLFGGRAEETRGDTWTLAVDVVTTWNNFSVGLPARRAGANLLSVPSDARLWLFGGLSVEGQRIWSWNGQRWAEECRVGTLCGVSTSPNVDPNVLWATLPSGEAWLYGSGSGLAVNGRWNPLSGWTIESIVPSPSVGQGMSYAYDPVAARLHLHGGTRLSSGMIVDDQWSLSGGAWTPICTGMTCGPRPPARQLGAMAYDPEREALVLFGGENSVQTILGDLWELTQGQWQQRTIINGPGPRTQHALIWNPVRKVLVLTGGIRLDESEAETWEYDGAAWRAITEASRPSLALSAVTWDGARRRVVAFGGATTDEGALTADTWEYHLRGNLCGSDGECDTGHCVDGVCCESSACAPCERCDGPTPGRCSAIVNGVDLECVGVCGPTGYCGAQNGTACTLGTSCASTYCSSSGVCAGPAALGVDCGADADCDSNRCVDGVCCGAACDGRCERCDVAGARGTCSATPGVDLDGDCVGAGAAPCAGTCTAQRTCAMPAQDRRCNTCLSCDGMGGCTAGRGSSEDLDCRPVVCTVLSTECRVYGAPAIAVGYCDARACADEDTVGACPNVTALPDGTPCGLGECVAGECVGLSQPPAVGCHCDYARDPLSPPPIALVSAALAALCGRRHARRDSSRVRAKNHG